jgi:cyanophycinase-like exopeptidase
MTPPGRFLLLGSGEFEPWAGEAERFALSGASGDGSAVVLATASGREGQAVFDRWTHMGLAHYASLDIPALAVRVRNRADALAPGMADPIHSASMVFFSGGSPAYLAATLIGTPVWDAITRLIARGGVFAGCSAGAMVAGAGGPFPFASGLGLVSDTAFGVHWDALSGWWIRWLRDLAPRRLPRSLAFVGIAEHTAIATDGDRWRVFGAGVVDVRARGRRSALRAGETFPR